MEHIKKFLRFLGQWLWNILVSLDQLVNTIFWGDPDETISSRIGKHVHWKGDKGWRMWLSKFLDIFDKGHTKRSIEADRGTRKD